jgi:hypothetical protein
MSELPTSALGVVKLFPESKQQVEIFSAQLVESVKHGLVNPLALKSTLKMIEKVIKIVDEGTRGEQLTEAQKYSEKTFNAYGFEIQRTEVGTEYDYLSCGDPVYEQRHAAVESAKSLLNDRASFLRSLREPLTTVDEQSGEVVTIRPPLKKSTTGLKFTLK